MLTFFDSRSRFHRRAFLRIGAAAGVGLPMWGVSLAATDETRRLLSGKSVILVFLHGGPSQFETFDPKLSAPVGVQSATGEISTAIPGVTFGSSFPRLAQIAHRLTVVRSYQPGNSNHDIKPVVSPATRDACVSSLYARVAGASDTATGMPTSALLVPQAVDPMAGPAQTQFGRLDSTGGLGPAFAPFVPGAGGQLQQDLQLALPSSRLSDRRALLDRLDRARWMLDRKGAMPGADPLREQAFNTLLGGQVARAFDLAQEDPRTIARYDTAPLVTPTQIDRKWNNYPHYCDNANTLGKLLLLARRLCEVGCGFVTVTTNFVWDMHADVNNAPMIEGMRYTAPPLDHALSALVDDLHERGLNDKVLVVVVGEIGRTPRINATGGRDHWGNLGPLLLVGGGFPMGRVIGNSTRDGSQPATEPIRVSNLVATMLQTLVDSAQLRLIRGMPAEVIQAATSEPILGLA